MTLNDKTQKAFENWLTTFGVSYNPCDVKRFNEFAALYCKDDSNVIGEQEFVKRIKDVTHITRRENRGIAQKFYSKLNTIKLFCKDNKIF